MSHWYHRVVKSILPNGLEWFSVREVFYDDKGEVDGYTKDPVDISGETVEGLKEYCQWILNCFDKDVIVEDKES